MRSRWALALVLLVLLLVSCSKTEFAVGSLYVQPYVCRDGRMGMSVYVVASGYDENSVQFYLRDPEGNLSWSFGACKAELDGLDYLGNSDICMPYGSHLPEGMWTLDIMYKDGSKVSRDFVINYGDAEAALQHYMDAGTEEAWYDSAENLTVLP